MSKRNIDELHPPPTHLSQHEGKSLMEYTRRHTFALGFLLQIFATYVFAGSSPVIDKLVLFLSILALITVIVSHLKSNQKTYHQRRWFFLLGLGLSTLISLHRAQRIGILFQGSSYYLKHSPQLKLARSFRNVIFTRNNNDLSEADLVKSLLPPTTSMLLAGQHVEETIGKDTTDLEFLKGLSDYFINETGVLPPALHANSVITPFVDVAESSVDKNHNQHNHNQHNQHNSKPDNDIVLIVFNGILGEFIDAHPFDELFEKNSTFENEWNTVLTKDNILDSTWSLDALSQVDKTMKELFDATSVDNIHTNQPEYRVLRYRPPFGSLDSIGTLASSSVGWLRRMSKIHAILKTNMKLNPRYVFVGYSRGANLALDVLARGHQRKDAHSWISDVTGLVSVGGPLFGAEGADFAHLPGHVFYDLLEPIRSFARKLDFEHEGDAGSMGHAKEILKNSYEFLKLGWELASVDQSAKSNTAKQAETMFQKECGDVGVPLPSLSVITDGFKQLLINNFDLMNPVGQYYENIKRVKIFVAAMLDGVKDLSTKSRLQWWNKKTNQLPKHIALFSIPATMPGAGEPIETLDQSVLFSSASTSADWWTNRMFYFASYGDTGKQCQDGQVSCDRAIFWPEMMSRCGWDTNGRETGILAVIGSHHWGLALPYALDGVPSHLPRGAVLDGIGSTFVKREMKKRRTGWFGGGGGGL